MAGISYPLIKVFDWLSYSVKDSTVSRQAPDFHHKRKALSLISTIFSENSDFLNKIKIKLLKMNK